MNIKGEFMNSVNLMVGDCIERMRSMADNSVDSVVTDPPYELGFMGKAWDSTGIANSVEMWKEALRVLKPGGHLLAFSGSRTYHRMTCAIEDAGFEVRDQIMWVYGSGFPKSLDVSKAIDKAAGAVREVVGVAKGKGGENLNVLARANGNDGDEAKGCGAYGIGAKQVTIDIPITAPATELAQQWQGWGTALKPAFEPLVVAMKPPASLDAKTLIFNLSILKAKLCSLSLVNAAEKTSMLNHPELSEVCAIAQWTAADCISTLDDLYDQMDTLQLESTVNTSLNTVSSWQNTLEELLKRGNTFTTKMKSDTTMHWKILNSYLSQITPSIMVVDQTHQFGGHALVSSAGRYFNAALKKLSVTLELFALEPATSQGRQNYLDVDASVKHEPICVARKPLAKGNTVAANVLQFGTGAINIDACRVDCAPRPLVTSDRRLENNTYMPGLGGSKCDGETSLGRWPANLIHSGCQEVLDLFPDSNGSGPARKLNRSAKTEQDGWGMNSKAADVVSMPDAGTGSAARFFKKVNKETEWQDQNQPSIGRKLYYCAKTSKKDRGEGNNHPTVKPTDLMRYLVRLVTPPNGTVLDPFMGSGSTGKAAIAEGFNFIGIDMDEAYVAIAKARMGVVSEELVEA